MSKTRILRLIAGEEIIGKVSQQGNLLMVEDPIQIMTQWRQDGTVGFGFVPFMPSADKNIIYINDQNLTAEAEPMEGVLKEYTRLTSGIII